MKGRKKVIEKWKEEWEKMVFPYIMISHAFAADTVIMWCDAMIVIW